MDHDDNYDFSKRKYNVRNKLIVKVIYTNTKQIKYIKTKQKQKKVCKSH